MIFTSHDYCKAILISRDVGLSSIEKFFLIRVICSFGLSVEVMNTVKELVKVLALSEAVLSRTRDDLVRRGYLEKLSGPLTSGGRPRKCFKISAHLLQVLQTGELGRDLCNSQSIEQMLFSTTLQDIYVLDREGKNRKIKPPVRILICILLAHATDVGLVSGLGHADLRKLIGGKLDRLKSQLDTLYEVGFILARRSGFTYKQTGKLFKGQYALNFMWEGLCHEQKPEQVVFCLGSNSNAGMSGANKDYVAYLEYTQLMKNYGRVNGIPMPELSKLIIKLGVDMQRYISWSISEYASYLSNRRAEAGELCEATRVLIEQEFKGKIRDEIESIWYEGAFEDELNFINSFVCSYVLMLADKVIAISDSLFKDRIVGRRYFLVPNDYNPEKRGFCVAIFDGHSVSATTVIQEVVECEGGENRIKRKPTHKSMDKIEQKLKRIYGFM